jgi:mono/diheme cytochrome c family protein
MSAPVQSTPIADATAPRAGAAAVPIWLIILLFVSLYWGMVYFDLHGAWFNPQVYAPYRSDKELATMQPAMGGDEDLLRKGKQIFSLACAVCHMETGVGNPANGCPPLAGSEWVAAPGTGRIIRIVSKGLNGPLQVKGQSYGTGTMLPVGDQLPGDEKEKSETIAAIISYVRKTFGNVPVAAKPEQVQAVRGEIKGHSAPFTAEELKAVPEDK